MVSPSSSPAPTDRAPLVLLVDDDPAVLAALELLLAIDDIASVSAASPSEAMLRVEDPSVAVVLQDMNFAGDLTSGGEGAALFRKIRHQRPELPVILMTAWASLEMAVELVKEGASDYIAKPWDDDKLVAKVRALLPSSPAARMRLPEGAKLCGLVYADPAMHEVVSLALRIAPSDASVLITGPNGSGKDRVASLIHENSRRVDKPFVRVDLGALPENLLEAELFGAEPGAYTGATRRRIGHFEAASGGTLFLDEIGNLPLPKQMKLLRALQTGEFQRVGSSEARRSDVRVLAATNLPLVEAIRRGAFREDLYFRLAVIEIRVPPLCERLPDVLLLAEHFLAEHAPSPRELSADARLALSLHDWPGNVRELHNRIRRAVLVGSNPSITARDLGLEPPPESQRPPPTSPPSPADDDERRQLQAVLDATSGVVARAAAELGLSRQALYRKMKRLGLSMERRAKDV